MLKKLFISFLFFTAFSIVMAHSIIPHFHHEDEANEHNDSNHDDDNPLSVAFSHFLHFTPTNENVFTHQLISVKQTDIPQSAIALIVFYWFDFFDTGQPVPIIFPDPPFFYSSSGIAAFGLRGPPEFTL